MLNLALSAARDQIHEQEIQIRESKINEASSPSRKHGESNSNYTDRDDGDDASVTERLNLQAEIISLKAAISEKEATVVDYESIIKKEAARHQVIESDLQDEIILLRKRRDAAEIKQGEIKNELKIAKETVGKVEDEAVHLKEKLEERGEYIQALEKTVDEQSRALLSEEKKFVSNIEKYKDKLKESARLEDEKKKTDAAPVIEIKEEDLMVVTAVVDVAAADDTTK